MGNVKSCMKKGEKKFKVQITEFKVKTTSNYELRREKKCKVRSKNNCEL